MSIRILSQWFTFLVALVSCFMVQGQVPSNPVPRGYDGPMQRLLLYHIGHSTYGIAQDRMELDSAMFSVNSAISTTVSVIFKERVLRR